MSAGLNIPVHNSVSCSHLDCDIISTPVRKHVPRKGDRATVLSLWKYRSLFVALGARSAGKCEVCSERS
jgi:hypothetical protein